MSLRKNTPSKFALETERVLSGITTINDLLCISQHNLMTSFVHVSNTIIHIESLPLKLKGYCVT